MTDRCEPDAVAAGLDAALPAGLDIVAVCESGPAALADQLQVSSWEVRVGDVTPAELGKAVTVFLAERSVVVERVTGKGKRELDARDAVLRAEVEQDEPVVRLVLRHMTPTVRP